MNAQVLISDFEMGERKEMRVAALVSEPWAQLVGTASVVRAGERVATIFQLHVTEEWRGRGVGSEMVARMEEACAKKGSEAMSVIVEPLGPVEWWEHRGYRVAHLEGQILILTKSL